MIVAVVTITIMLVKMMHGSSNPQWILIVFILDHMFTNKFPDALFNNPYNMLMTKKEPQEIAVSEK
jgi:hypothetical protein